MDEIPHFYQNLKPEFQEKFSELFLMSYSFSKGGVSLLIPKKEKSLAYCIEPPHHVFEEIFPEYFVTNYKGADFFNPGEIEQGEKVYSLGITELEPVIAGGVGIEKILDLNLLEDFKRKTPSTKQEAQKFLLEFQRQQRLLWNLSERISEKGIKEFYERQTSFS